MTADRISTRRRPPTDLPASERTGRGSLVALLSVVGTFALVCLLSPGLRSDLGQVVALLGEIDADGIRDWLLSFGAFSPVVYFLIVVAQVVVNPIPAGPVTLAGALVFGIVPGLSLSMAGSVVGSVLVFLAVRRWGETLILKVVAEETYSKYAGKLDDGGWWFFVIMLLPMMPDDVVCALAGLSKMSFGRYVFFMVVGRLPGATVTALLASNVITGSVAAWISVGLIIVALLAVGLVWRKRIETGFLRRMDDSAPSHGPTVEPAPRDEVRPGTLASRSGVRS